MPGALDYNDLEITEIWQIKQETPSTAFITTDVNNDGEIETIFGTSAGKIFIVHDESNVIMLNISKHRINSIAIGNVDNEPSNEIIIYSDNSMKCMDFDTRAIQWTSIMPSTIALLSLFDDNSDGTSDILFLWNSTLCGISGEGKKLFNTTLMTHSGELGPSIAWEIDDIELDGHLEAVVICTGIDMFTGIRGRDIWIIGLEGGFLEYHESHPGLEFTTNLALYPTDRGKNISICTRTITGSGMDIGILVLDGATKTFQHSIIQSGTNNINWLHLQFIPNEEPLLMLCADNLHLLGWSIEGRAIRWEYYVEGLYSIESHPIICDVDNDKAFEAMLIPNDLVIFDTVHGKIKKSGIVTNGQYMYCKCSTADFDHDNFIEICFGYYDINSRLLRIILVDTPDFTIHLDEDANGGIRVFYAGKPNPIKFRIDNMTEARIPHAITLNITNPTWNGYSAVTISLDGQTKSTSGELSFDISSINHNSDVDGSHLEIRVIPSWGFSIESPNTVMLHYIDNIGLTWEQSYPDVFRVERDLVFSNGTLAECRGKILAEDDWVAIGSQINITNLVVIYEGSKDEIPPANSYLLAIKNGTVESNQTVDLSTVRIEVPIGHLAYPIWIRILQVPINLYSNDTYALRLRIDDMTPKVVDFYPDNSTWICTRWAKVAILVWENESGIKPYPKYYVSNSQLPRSYADHVWTSVDARNLRSEESGTIVEIMVNLEEGRSFVYWQVKDNVDNTVVFNHSVRVDLTQIQFSLTYPKTWINTSTFHCIVHVTDTSGSGVNGSSIQYSLSYNDLFSFSHWSPTTTYQDDMVLDVDVEITAIEGKFNYIRFMGKDIAGNTALSSDAYQLWVDTTPPVIIIETPANNSKVSPEDRTIKVMISDYGSGIREIEPLLTNNESRLKINAIRETTLVNDTTMIIVLRWNATSWYSFRFDLECTDNVNNSIHSPTIYFWVNRPPSVHLVSPRGEKDYLRGSIIEFNVECNDPDGDDVRISWILDGGLFLSNASHFTNYSLPKGRHKIVVTVEDDYYSISDFTNITIEEKKISIGNPSLYIPLLLLVCVSIAIVMMMRRRLIRAGSRFRGNE